MRRRIFIISGILVACLLAVLLFYYELVFAFQRMRIGQLGCPCEERVKVSSAIDSLQPCQKLWVHRTDSYERFQYLAPFFQGLELDLVFDTTLRQFRVYHPPLPPSNLMATAYFEAIRSSGKKLWLDVKGLDPAVADEAVQYFIQADQKYRLKQQVIVESSEPAFVNKLAAQGFYTSFLVPAVYLDGLQTITPPLAEEVKFVSQEEKFVEKLKEKFPGKKIITWSISFNNYLKPSHLYSLMNDTSIKVILINVKSRNYK